MAKIQMSQMFFLSSITELCSVNSIEKKYSKETFGTLKPEEMDQQKKTFVGEVLRPRKKESIFWETLDSRLSLIQKTTFIGVFIIGCYNIERGKFLESKEVITITPLLQVSIGLPDIIAIFKDVTKAISTYKKKKVKEAQDQKQFFTDRISETSKIVRDQQQQLLQDQQQQLNNQKRQLRALKQQLVRVRSNKRRKNLSRLCDSTP